MAAAARSSPTVAIHWFRKGLRLHDNPALLSACRSASVVYPVFILDPWFANPERVGAVRFRFLLECLKDLDMSLRERRSRLIVLRGKPDHVLPRAWAHWGAQVLTFEVDTEPYAQARDSSIREAAERDGVRVESPVGHTLYELPKLLKAAGGRMPVAYTAFQTLLGRVGPPPPPCEDLPSSLPPAPVDPPTDLCFESHSAESVGRVPGLAELGYSEPEAPPLFPGGEKEGLRRMSAKLADSAWVCRFEKPETAPTAVGEPSTTGLSPYLKFGALSARRFYAELHRVYRSAAPMPHSKPPVSLEGQLLWREFYYANAFAFPNYDRMRGNPVCRQIPWDTDERLARAWEEGRTGFPWIDACMRQLRAEGWLHHLGRHAVACFLTRGDLYQSWEVGARVFDKLLVDSDWALNNGNWMWLSASAYFYQFFRVYSPVAFPKKTDPNGDYVRRWVPELRKYPKGLIYEPWKAPRAMQEMLGCVVGRDYPERIVIHEEVLQRNMDRHKAAYAAHKTQTADEIAAAPITVGATQVGSAPHPSVLAQFAPSSEAGAAAASSSSSSAASSDRARKRSRSPES